MQAKVTGNPLTLHVRAAVLSKLAPQSRLERVLAESLARELCSHLPRAAEPLDELDGPLRLRLERGEACLDRLGPSWWPARSWRIASSP